MCNAGLGLVSSDNKSLDSINNYERNRVQKRTQLCTRETGVYFNYSTIVTTFKKISKTLLGEICEENTIRVQFKK